MIGILYLTSKKWNLDFHILEIAAAGRYEWLLCGEAIAMRLPEAAHARRSGVLFSSRWQSPTFPENYCAIYLSQ
jgi:hypothetical protein